MRLARNGSFDDHFAAGGHVSRRGGARRTTRGQTPARGPLGEKSAAFPGKPFLSGSDFDETGSSTASRHETRSLAQRGTSALPNSQTMVSQAEMAVNFEAAPTIRPGRRMLSALRRG